MQDGKVLHLATLLLLILWCDPQLFHSLITGSGGQVFTCLGLQRIEQTRAPPPCLALDWDVGNMVLLQKATEILNFTASSLSLIY